jgi:tetratricopeptide (TPR) repeat protein
MIGLPIHAQSALAAKPRPPKEKTPSAKEAEPQLLPGVVVEKVEKNSEAEKAGLREGDVLLSWSRGDQQGKIESPFDVSWLDTEQRPMGTVIFYGSRNSQPASWKLGAVFWKLGVRPNIPLSLQSKYLDALKRGGFNNQGALKEFLGSEPVPSRRSSLRSWLFLQAAADLVRTRFRKQAAMLYQKAYQEADRCTPRIKSEILRMAADFWWWQMDFRRSEELYERALVGAEKENPESLSVARLLLRIGSTKLSRAEDLSATEAYYFRALQIQQRLIPGQFDVSLALDALGEVAREKNDLLTAENYLLKARAIQDQFGCDNEWCATTMATLGALAFDKGDFREAETYTRRSLKIQTAVAPMSYRLALALDMLGVIAWYRGDLEGAEKYFGQQITILRQVNPASLPMAYALANVGATVRDRGHFAQARKYFYQAISIGQRLAPNGEGMARSLSNLATLAFQENKLVEAEKYFNRALTIETAIAPESLDVTFILNDLGALSVRRGDQKRALAYYRQAEKVAPESPPPYRNLSCNS